MRKITLLVLVAATTLANAQTVLFNYEDVGTDFQFCFDAPDPDQCTSNAPQVNNDTTGANPTANFFETTAPTTGGDFSYGFQAQLLGGDSNQAGLPTIDGNGAFLTIAFRASSNPTGDIPLVAQLIGPDEAARIDAFNSYTATDGSWQLIEFDFTGGIIANGFTNATPIRRVGFFAAQGAANGLTYGVDEAILNTEATLSSNDFSISEFTVWPNPGTSTLHIGGNVSNETVSIYDVRGVQISSKVISGRLNTVDISALSEGVYVLKFQSGTSYKFIKQ